MERKEIFERLRKIIVSQLDVKEPQVIPEAKLVSDLGADSLDIVEIVMHIEDQFKIKIPDDDLEGLSTIQDVVDYLYGRLREKIP